MRPLLSAALACALALAAPVGPASAGAGAGTVRPLYGPAAPLYQHTVPRRGGDDGGGSLSRPGWGRSTQPGFRSAPTQIFCDRFGRCWQQLQGPSRYGGFGARPPGWADDLPDRLATDGRFARPRSGVVCDFRTSICYKDGRVDKSETKDAFGERAADRADDLRDRRGTGRVFAPERGVSCDSVRRICFDGGFADRSLTRRYFGEQAADNLD